MAIDSRLSKEEQWQWFGHEVAHIFLHSGNQTMLPKSIIINQEPNAYHFALEFCVPTFMLNTIKLPCHKNKAVTTFIAEKFGVTKKFAYERLRLVNNDMVQY